MMKRISSQAPAPSVPLASRSPCGTDFPTLRALLSATFHQDWLLEQSASDGGWRAAWETALASYASDEREILACELSALRRQVAPAALPSFLHDELFCYYRPETAAADAASACRAWLDALSERLKRE